MLCHQFLNLGYISRATAENSYGVVIGEAREIGGRTRFKIDANASAVQRAKLAATTAKKVSAR